MSSFVWKRTHTLVAVLTALVLVGGGIGLASALSGPGRQLGSAAGGALTTGTTGQGRPSTSKPSVDKPKPKPVDFLTGGKVSHHEVFAVKVENIALARPQVGLHDADIVFAEEVEGAQTRLIAIYHTVFPTAVEPVRSARTTDARLLPMFGRPGLVYSGANTKVQRRIDQTSIVPLYNASRDPRRVAPHNVRVNLKHVAAMERVGRAQSIGWTFDPAVPKGSVTAKTAKIKVGHDTFGFAYAKGRYAVRWNGRPYADGDNGTPTFTDNVVVLKVANRSDGNRDVLGTPSVYSDTVGHGDVTIYRNGTKISGTWKRGRSTRPLRLLDRSGQKIPLKPGKTWVLLQG
jgi:hypothetical protein